MARRRWIADEFGEGRAAVTGERARHLARVLRAQVGARYEVAAEGRVWVGVVASVSEERVGFELEEEVAAEGPLPLVMVLAVWKFDRMEWAIEKLTELGVERIAPVVARRTEKHLGQAAAGRVERWRRIAGEASRQSRRPAAPVVDEPVALRAALEMEWPGARIRLAEEERMVMLADVPAGRGGAVTLAVGPEGGWAEEEAALFAGAGWTAASLGPRVLRAETAAVAGAAVVGAGLLG